MSSDEDARRDDEPTGIPALFGQVLGSLFALMGRLLAGVLGGVLAAFGIKAAAPSDGPDTADEDSPRDPPAG